MTGFQWFLVLYPFGWVFLGGWIWLERRYGKGGCE